MPESADVPPPLQSSPVASQNNLDEIARKEKARLVELLKSKGGRTGSYPQFTVSVKGQKVSGLFKYLNYSNICGSQFPFCRLSCCVNCCRGINASLVIYGGPSYG